MYESSFRWLRPTGQILYHKIRYNWIGLFENTYLRNHGILGRSKDAVVAFIDTIGIEVVKNEMQEFGLRG